MQILTAFATMSSRLLRILTSISHPFRPKNKREKPIERAKRPLSNRPIERLRSLSDESREGGLVRPRRKMRARLAPTACAPMDQAKCKFRHACFDCRRFAMAAALAIRWGWY
jgi:hypothetical protein